MQLKKNKISLEHDFLEFVKMLFHRFYGIIVGKKEKEKIQQVIPTKYLIKRIKRKSNTYTFNGT